MTVIEDGGDPSPEKTTSGAPAGTRVYHSAALRRT